jgi:hypothetical protein
MAETKKKEENVDGIQYYGFEDDDLFPGAKKDADKPIPEMTFDSPTQEPEIQETKSAPNLEPKRKAAEKSLISENDLAEILNEGRASGNFAKNDVGEKVSNLIRKEDADSKHVLSPIDFQKGIEMSTGISKNDWSEIANDIQNNDFLNDDFMDFVEYPKISGDEINFVGKKLITSSHIKHSNDRVEITDETDLSNDEEHHTSIEINRNDNGDIDSISVYCKCGEVTQLTFNYHDESNQEPTEYFKTKSGIDTMNLEKIKINPKH